ncbi:MAG TPA: hypothetical protein VH020_01050 [Stellaceae bacterium]|nr:hypothetical protein [Stellaceae bacterium]
MHLPHSFRAVPAVLALLLAACQPLPHPFADNHPPPSSPIMSPPDAVGILVQPVTGAPGPVAAAALAKAMADALCKEDVPADTDASNRRSYRLATRVRAQPSGGDRARVAVDWVLAAADGHVVGRETVTQEVPAAAFLRGDSAIAKALVAKPASALARRVEGDAPVEHIPHAPVVALAPVTGAPGDGGHALSLAIGNGLQRAGIELKDQPDGHANYLLVGKVDIGAITAGHQEVKIVWTVSRAGGGEIGQVSQENAVPAGSLDGAWGDTAYDVASAALGGIVALIQQAQGGPSGG